MERTKDFFVGAFPTFRLASLSLCTFLAVAFSASLHAAPPDLFLAFEDEADPEFATDSGAAGYRIKLAGNSRVSDGNAKSGEASLQIGGRAAPDADRGDGLEVMIGKAGLEPLAEEIRKMTIAAWVHPADPGEFLCFRRIPGRTSAPGYFQFTYLGEGRGRFYFSMAGEAGEDGNAKNHQTMSTEVAPLHAGDWNHIAMTFDEGRIVFYANGEPVGQPCFLEVNAIPAAAIEHTSIKAFSGLRSGSFVDDFVFLGARALQGEEISELFYDGPQQFIEKQ